MDNNEYRDFVENEEKMNAKFFLDIILKNSRKFSPKQSFVVLIFRSILMLLCIILVKLEIFELARLIIGRLVIIFTFGDALIFAFSRKNRRIYKSDREIITIFVLMLLFLIYGYLSGEAFILKLTNIITK